MSGNAEVIALVSSHCACPVSVAGGWLPRIGSGRQWVGGLDWIPREAVQQGFVVQREDASGTGLMSLPVTPSGLCSCRSSRMSTYIPPV